jgi:16S rRNA (guanine527-N7)-methyltransferase
VAAVNDRIAGRFAEWLRERSIVLSDRQLAQFEAYFRELVEWNEKMNLTAITEREQVYVKHFYDSVSLSFFVPMAEVGSLADIGTGAGFPGIPLKIAFPHLRLTLIDSLNKRVRFLEHVAGRLGLEGVTCIHARAEDAAREPGLRDAFDLVTARAVARLPLLNELCLPFAKPGGRFVAMKGSDVTEEVGESGRSLRELGGELGKVHRFRLPLEEAERHLVEIRKVRRTPKAYPRKAGIPAKQPLV